MKRYELKAFVNATEERLVDLEEGGGPGGADWGDIGGTLADQTDLQTALDAKQAADADLTTWAGLTPSANHQSLVTAANYAAMRALLDLEAGTDFYSKAASDAAFQPIDADLTTWAGLTPTANAQSLVTAANYAAMRGLLDLEAGTDFYSIAAADAAFQPLDADLTTWAGVTSSANGRSLVSAADYAAMRALLDLEVGTDFYSIAAANAAFQPVDADLTTIAGLTATSDNFIQAKSSAWASRTVAQVKVDLALTGTNSGDQTTIVGITGTLAEFNTALTGADFATGGGTVTGASSGTNTGDQTSIVGITGTIAQFNTAISDGDLATGGGTASGTNTGDQTTIVGITGTAAQFNTAVTDGDIAFIGAANTFTADQTVSSTDAGSGAGPLLDLDRNSASPAAGDSIGAYRFKGRSSLGTNRTYGTIQGKIVTETDAAEDATIDIRTMRSGTSAQRLLIGAGVFTAAATGGDQGVDTVNAANYFDDGVNINLIYLSHAKVMSRASLRF